jgi:hypothetical protein
MELFRELVVENVKVLTPILTFMGIVTISDAKDLTIILGGIVSAACTIAVTVSTLTRNKPKG